MATKARLQIWNRRSDSLGICQRHDVMVRDFAFGPRNLMKCVRELPVAWREAVDAFGAEGAGGIRVLLMHEARRHDVTAVIERASRARTAADLDDINTPEAIIDECYAEARECARREERAALEMEATLALDEEREYRREMEAAYA